MTHHNKYLLYGPDLIVHGHHFPAAHSGTSLLVSCSTLLTFGCLPMSWCASSKAPTLLPMPFSGSGPSMHMGTMVRFSRWAVYWSFPLYVYTKGFFEQNQGIILLEVLQTLGQCDTESLTDKSHLWWWTNCHKVVPFPSVELNLLAHSTITSQAVKDPYRIARKVT